MDSLQNFWDAAVVFFRRLEDIDVAALGLALLFHSINLLLRTYAWWQILRAAYPGTRYPWRSCAAAYIGGVGLNAVTPARVGDVVKISLVRLKLEGSHTPTILATLLVETLVDMVFASLLFAWAIYLGVFPSLPELPEIAAFELSWLAANSNLLLAFALFLAVMIPILLRMAHRRAKRLWAEVHQGFSILRDPRRYVVVVALPQIFGWLFRLLTMVQMLRAFGIEASVRNALLVMVVASITTLLPITPGGVGTQQALLVVVLRGSASSTALIAFSVGMQVAITLANAVAGAIVLVFTLRHFSLRRAIAEARAHQDAETAPPAPP